MSKVPGEIVEAIERLGAQSNGDVPVLVAAARSTAEGPFADDALLAYAIEQAANRRAAAGDRGGVWWLACALSTLRTSPLASPQDDAELNAARVLGELQRSPAATSPLPQAARWIVSGQGEPNPSKETIELARKNATTYVERLDAELAGRAPSLRARAEGRNASVLAAIDEALFSYAVALASTRAALSRVIDHLVGRSGDANLSRAGEAALAELDDVVAPAVRARIDEVRRAMSGSVAPPVVEVSQVDEVARPSFAGAAPPTFQPGSSPSAPSVHPDRPPERPSVDDLDRAMRAAFERAWASPDPGSLAAFEQAVRARYEVETASMPDPEARRKALDHYVAHAMAQLPAR